MKVGFIVEKEGMEEINCLLSGMKEGVIIGKPLGVRIEAGILVSG